MPDTPSPFATLLESRPGVPKAIHDDSIDVDDLPGVHTSPVRNRDVLAVRAADGPRLRDAESRGARRHVVRAVLELAALLDSRTDFAKPSVGTRDSSPALQRDPQRAANRARLERAAREAGERIQKRARRR